MRPIRTLPIWMAVAAIMVIATVAVRKTANAETTVGTYLALLPTAIPTLDPLQAALQLARDFSGGNHDWQPFATIFPDDPAGVEMMLAPAGEFMMGSAHGSSGERPPHAQIFEAPFWIDRTEVTRAMYTQCVAAGECTPTPESEYSTRDSQPINRVTWVQARDYCEWRGARLPTEREWEYTARGPDGWVYPWGNDFVAENVVYRANSENVTADVGSKADGASWVGALDMSGNVWEWVSSPYLNYPYETGNEINDDTRTRVLRGGSLVVGGRSNLRAAFRKRGFPTYEGLDLGFRCARS